MYGEEENEKKLQTDRKIIKNNYCTCVCKTINQPAFIPIIFLHVTAIFNIFYDLIEPLCSLIC